MPSGAHGQPVQVDAGGTSVRLTSPDREVFPGVSKRQVLDYYLAVSERMLPQVAGRPTALERWPDGVRDGVEHFYQKHLPRSAPAYVHGIGVRFPSGRPGVLLDPDTSAALCWAAQMGTLTFHSWPVRRTDVEHPDQLRLDLDPAPANSWADVLTVALLCREILEEWSWSSYVKTSGGRGLHVFVPVLPTGSFVDVRHAAIAIGREAARRRPDLVTMSWWKEERGDRVFVDFNQNAQDRVMASAYSLRARPDAPASMPVSWSDLPDVDPDSFTVRTVPGLVSSGPDPWHGMGVAPADLAPALEWWERDLHGGEPELPYPPDFPKMPGEPPRVQPSRRRINSQAAD